MGEAALMQLELSPSYPGGRFGPLFAQDLLPCCFLERKSHWCHQGKLLLATPQILADLWQIHGTTNEPLILSASKTFHLLTPVGDDQTTANPKRASWDESTAPPWLNRHFHAIKALEDQARGKGRAVGCNHGWSIIFISYNPTCAFPRPSLCAEPCCAGKAGQPDLRNKDSLILLGNKTEKLLIQSEQKAD